jgi:hypothetical protein
MISRKNRRLRGLTAVLLAAFVTLGLAACGGGATQPASRAPQTAQRTPVYAPPTAPTVTPTAQPAPTPAPPAPIAATPAPAPAAEHAPSGHYVQRLDLHEVIERSARGVEDALPFGWSTAGVRNTTIRSNQAMDSRKLVLSRCQFYKNTSFNLKAKE